MMKVRFDSKRSYLYLTPEDDEEGQFVKYLVRLVQGVSNKFIAWRGDGKSMDTYIISWKPRYLPGE